MLLATLGIAIVAWSDIAIHSPLRGWIGKLAYRMTAYPPCSDCVMTSHRVNGITVMHPDDLKVATEVAVNQRSYIYSVIDRWERCGLSFHVMTVPVGKAQAFRDRYLKSERVLAERQLNGWRVVSLAAHSPSVRSVALFGADRFVAVDGFIDERSLNTALSRWLNLEFDATIERLCAQNASGDAGQADTHDGTCQRL